MNNLNDTVLFIEFADVYYLIHFQFKIWTVY